MRFSTGQPTLMAGDGDYREVAGAIDGTWTRFLNGPADLEKVELTASEAAAVEVLTTDGGPDLAMVLAVVWAEWKRRAAARVPRNGPHRLDRSCSAQQ